MGSTSRPAWKAWQTLAASASPGPVYEQIATRLALGYEDLGDQAVKNIARPVRVYRVRLEPGAAAPRGRRAPWNRGHGRLWRW